MKIEIESMDLQILGLAIQALHERIAATGNSIQSQLMAQAQAAAAEKSDPEKAPDPT